MNVLLLSKYSRLGASSRLRTMQYINTAAFDGIRIEVKPLFDDSYLKNLYSNAATAGSTMTYLAHRIRSLITGVQADAIWLEYEALPWVPWFLEKALLPKGIPIVADLDDAVFHRYDLHPSPLVRRALGKKIAKIIRASSVVVAGNQYIADYARDAGANCVVQIPTVVDLNQYNTPDKTRVGDPLKVGWIGTPQTWTDLAKPVFSTLSGVLAKANADFCAIGASLVASSHDRLEIVPWAEATEASLIQSLDIGLMPLPDSPWTRGKCGYKLIQYMACGLPVIASPVGANCEIVTHGTNGFLAETDQDWREAVQVLLHDRELRSRMGQAGREVVKKRYSLDVWSPKMADIFNTIKMKT